MFSEASVRPAQRHEFAAVLQLWDRSGVTPPSESDSIGGLTQLAATAGAVLLVAVIDDQIIGSVIGGWDGWRGNIYRLAVAPEYRRRGIARRLVEGVSRALFDQGAQRIGALVEHEHSWAVRFWESLSELGYRLDPQFVRYIADRKSDEKVAGDTARGFSGLSPIKEDLAMKRTARCQCGGLCASVTGDPVMVNVCHCVACQHRTGAPFSYNVYFERSQVQFEGQRSCYERDGQEGRKLRHYFCPICGTTVFWDADISPERYGIPVALFDAKSFPPPALSFYEENSFDWVVLPEGVTHFQRGRTLTSR